MGVQPAEQSMGTAGSATLDSFRVIAGQDGMILFFSVMYPCMTSERMLYVRLEIWRPMESR